MFYLRSDKTTLNLLHNLNTKQPGHSSHTVHTRHMDWSFLSPSGLLAFLSKDDKNELEGRDAVEVTG